MQNKQKENFNTTYSLQNKKSLQPYFSIEIQSKR